MSLKQKRITEAANFVRSKIMALKPLTQDEAAADFMRRWIKSNVFHLCYYLAYDEVSPKVHGEIVSALMDPSPRKIICVPRGTFKSSIGAIVYPIWRLLLNPNLRILIDSELYSNSITYLRAIRTHLESDRMIDLFGYFEDPKVWREDALLIRQRTRNYKEPSLTAGGIGTTKVGQHYELIIGDDYNSPANTATSDQADKVIQHYRYNLNILEPKGEYIIIGTRYAENDLIGWLLKEILNEPRLAEGIF